MSTSPAVSTVDQIIENASRYNGGRQVRILLDAAMAFDRLEQPTQDEINKFKELFYSLIEQTSDTDKRQISIVVARNVYTPRAIILYLALQDVATASPVLLYSPLIGEVDIVTIAGKCDELALRVLSRRNELTSSAVRAIVARRDPSSINILRQNPSVNKSESLSLLPPYDGSTKPDNSVSREQDAGTRPMKDASQTREEILALASPGKPSVQRKTVSGIYTDTSGAPGILLQTARTRDKAEFFQQLAKQLGLEPVRLKKLILDDPQASMSTALRALEVPTNVASQIMLLMDPEIGTSINKLRTFMKLYDALESDDCKSRLLSSGVQFTGNRISQSRSKQADQLPQHSKSVESQLAAALRERRTAINEGPPVQKFGRRTHAA